MNPGWPEHANVRLGVRSHLRRAPRAPHPRLLIPGLHPSVGIFPRITFLTYISPNRGCTLPLAV